MGVKIFKVKLNTYFGEALCLHTINPAIQFFFKVSFLEFVDCPVIYLIYIRRQLDSCSFSKKGEGECSNILPTMF